MHPSPRLLTTRILKPPTNNLILSALSRQTQTPTQTLYQTQYRYQYPQPTLTYIPQKAISKMSFSNTDTGSKEADPYKAKNIDNVSLKEKVEDLNEFIDACKFGMMTTRDGKTGALVSRCMAVAAKENGGTTLLFHTNTESGKTDELATDSHINISFLNSSGEWASISGLSTVETDRDLIKKYYTPTLKAWLGDLSDGVHDGGPNDPRIGIIKVDAKTATYAIVRKGLLARGVEVAQGAITGKAASVNKLREISEEEIQKWRTSLGMVQYVG